jgi:hypothetical protein
MMKTRVQALVRRKPVAAIIGLGMILPALAYLLAKMFLDRSDTVDFKFIWLAGYLWDQGIDAYSDAFATTGQAMFTGTNRPPGLLYPPSWYPIAALVAKLPYDLAAPVWRVVSGLMLILGSLISIKTVQDHLGRPGALRIGVFVLFMGASSASAISLSLGQTAPVIFLGVAFFLHAMFTRSTWPMIIALCLVMLKPNFGIVLVAFLLAQPFWWRAILGAMVVSLVASLPVFWASGLVTTVTHYLHQLSYYDALPTNIPPSATGLRNLVFHLTGLNLPSTGLALLGAAAAFAMGVVTHLRSAKLGHMPRDAAAGFALVLATAFLAVSLHTYDLLILGPLLLVTLRSAWIIQASVLGTMLILLRGNNLVLKTGFYFEGSGYSPDSFLASLAILLLFALALIAWMGRVETAAPSAP